MSDDLKDLFAAYPTVIQAICHVELFLCTGDEDHPVSAWDTFIAGQPGVAPQTVIDVVRQGCREELALGSPGRWADALAQCERPEFLTYIKGKMGLM